MTNERDRVKRLFELRIRIFKFFALSVFALVIFSLSVKFSLAATETFYVCNGGNGTQSETANCATAYSVSDFSTARNWSSTDANDGKIGPNDEVIVMDDGGVFTEVFTIRGSGLSEKPVTIKAQNGDLPVLNRRENITGWTNDGDGTYSKGSYAWFVSYLTEDDHPLIGASNSGLSDGNWYYDSTGDVIHYKPTSGVVGDHTTQVTIGSCLGLNNYSYITIEGLKFNHCNYGIYENTAGSVGVSNIIINNNIFDKNKGALYIMAANGNSNSNITVTNNTFTNNGNIYIGARSNGPEKNYSINFSNNTITDGNLTGWGGDNLV